MSSLYTRRCYNENCSAETGIRGPTKSLHVCTLEFFNLSLYCACVRFSYVDYRVERIRPCAGFIINDPFLFVSKTSRLLPDTLLSEIIIYQRL